MNDDREQEQLTELFEAKNLEQLIAIMQRQGRTRDELRVIVNQVLGPWDIPREMFDKLPAAMTITVAKLEAVLPDLPDAKSRLEASAAKASLAEAIFEASTLTSEAEEGARQILDHDTTAAYYSFDRASEDLDGIGDEEGARLCEWIREELDAIA